jgi:hypothetical protein
LELVRQLAQVQQLKHLQPVLAGLLELQGALRFQTTNQRQLLLDRRQPQVLAVVPLVVLRQPLRVRQRRVLAQAVRR